MKIKERKEGIQQNYTKGLIEQKEFGTREIVNLRHRRVIRKLFHQEQQKSIQTHALF